MAGADFKTKILDSRGLDFIRSSLTGPHRLSLILASKVATDQGITKAYVPERVPDHAVYDFSIGVGTLALRAQVRSEGAADQLKVPRRAISHLVHSVLEQNRGALCLVENWLAIPNDPAVQRAVSSGAPIVFSGNDVYHYLLHDDPLEKAVSTLDEADTGKLVGAISVDDFPKLVPGNEIDSRLLDVIVRHARLVFVTAYDGEGFVTWEPPRVAPDCFE